MTIHARFLPKYPKRIQVTDGLTKTEANGVVTLGFDYVNSEFGIELAQAVDTANADAASTSADRTAVAADKTAAEAAATAAEAARDVAIATNATFATKAAALAFAPTVAPAYIRLEGYTNAGIGGAVYKKAASEPSHAGKFSITLSDAVTVVWYEIAERVLTPFMFGALGGGTDDVTALQNWAVSPVSSVKRGDGGTFVSSAALVFNADDDVEGGVYDFSAATLAAGTAMMSMAGTLTLISATAAAYSRGNVDSLLISDVSQINVGDALILYDTNDYSFSPWRPVYRKGEFIRVGAKNSGTSTISAMLPLYDSYVLGTGVYKLGGQSGRFANLKIIQPYDQTVGLRISYLDRAVIDNVRTGGSTYTGMEIKVCFDTTFRAVPFQASPIVDDEYGVIISNSQGGVMTGMGASGRHPFAFGGGDYPCCVPCRGWSVFGATLSNLSAVSAGDLHGNTEDIKFVGVTFSSGTDIGGKNHKWIGCRFVGNRDSGIALYLGEPVSGDFHFDACTIESQVESNALGFAPIELSNWASVTGNCRFRFTNSEIKAPSGTTFLIREGIHAGSFSGSIEMSDCTIDAPSCDTLIRFERTAGATSIDHVTVADISGLPSGAAYAGNYSGGSLTVSKYKLPSQSGAMTIAFATGQATWSATVTYDHPYPIVPNLTVGAVSTNAGGAPVGFGATAGASSFSATVYTTTGVNFGSSGNASGTWTASLN